MQGSKDRKVNLTFAVSEHRIADLLIAGLEGGIQYWGDVVGHKKPNGGVEMMKFRTDVEKVVPHIDYPMNEGFGGVRIDVHEDGAPSDIRRYLLTRVGILEGLVAMAEEAPAEFGDWLSQNDDATTGDVFVQCCLFGKVVFG